MTTKLEVLSVSPGDHCLSAAAEYAFDRQQLFHAYRLKLLQQLNTRKDLVIDFTCLQPCLDPQLDQSSLFSQENDEEKVS